MDKKSKFEAFVSGAGKKAKDLLDSALLSAEQNDDGKFDFSDVSVIAENMGNTVKKGTQAIKETAEEKARLLELKTLQPLSVIVNKLLHDFLVSVPLDRVSRILHKQFSYGKSLL